MSELNSAQPDWRHRLPFHYAWLLLLTVSLTVFASIGLGRFSLGMILPSMGNALQLSYAEMGTIGTANFVGYFVAVLALAPISRRFTVRSMIFAGLLLVGSSLLVLAAARTYLEVVVLYTVTGVGSGIANIAAMGLLSQWFTARHRGKAAGFAVAGNGIAILLSGIGIPWINLLAPDSGWRISWIVIAGLCLLVAMLSVYVQRDRPQMLGLLAVGDGAGRGTAPGDPAPVASRRLLLHLGAIYFGFGFTYVIYATFVVTKLVAENQFSEAAAGQFWSWVGVLSLVSTPIFGSLSDRIGRKTGLLLVLGLQSVAYLLAAWGEPAALLYVSVVLFGLTAWSVPSMMAAAAGDYMGPARAAAGLAFLTLFFGVGQIAGPALAGWLAELSGSFRASFLLAALVAALAAVATLPLKPPRQAVPC